MMQKKQNMTSLQVLYFNGRLDEALDILDQLHTAASEGRSQQMTELERRELMAMLRDFIYTAQETIRELDQDEQPRPGAYLRVLENPMAKAAPPQRQVSGQKS